MVWPSEQFGDALWSSTFFSTDLGWSKNMFSEDMYSELAAIRVLKRSELA